MRLAQASQNANDGISLAQTAEGALQQVTNNPRSIRQLSVESANATNSASDRQALDAQVQQNIAEINRIATQTSFNNRNLLAGTSGNATFQVGANVGQTNGAFMTHSQVTREALEAAAPMLRTALNSQGFANVNVDAAQRQFRDRAAHGAHYEPEFPFATPSAGLASGPNPTAAQRQARAPRRLRLGRRRAQRLVQASCSGW